MITVYICDKKKINKVFLQENSLSDFCRQFNEYRTEKINKNYDRNLAIATAIVEKRALADFCDYDNINIVTQENGKPIVETDRPVRVYYNVSHSGDYAIAVAMAEEVGIDVQCISKMNEGVMRKIFSNEEIDRVNSAVDKNLEFTRIWAKKESYLKYTGDGIFKGMKEQKYKDCHFSEYVFDRYVISVCTRNPQGKIRLLFCPLYRIPH
ncbi:MAG: 4'-phosphopantetheinyl transferase superfamily protein [Lachnospiraceae bacterium]|nr:4'-phosphopantetheinyl transferase superfamily protein [Lachnospiraceae bacterium]